jgi:hypothetical protein
MYEYDLNPIDQMGYSIVSRGVKVQTVAWPEWGIRPAEVL